MENLLTAVETFASIFEETFRVYITTDLSYTACALVPKWSVLSSTIVALESVNFCPSDFFVLI